jgi:uncharacterized protein (TIGR03066 family)
VGPADPPAAGRGGAKLVSWRERFRAAPERFGAAGAVTRQEGRTMRAITGVALGVLLVASAGVSAQDKDKFDAKKLVGKWTPADKKENITIEFTKDGKLLLSVDIAGKVEKLDGTYKLDGNKLTIALKFMDKEMKEEVTVSKLTDDEMETTDSKGKKETLKKVK